VGNELGKRYQCEVCGTVVLCTRMGAGTIECDGQPMTMQAPRPLPSAD
jgi:desulfoferrodoxin-like iron-binding protein